jgi:hypothetical protein
MSREGAQCGAAADGFQRWFGLDDRSGGLAGAGAGRDVEDGELRRARAEIDAQNALRQDASPDQRQLRISGKSCPFAAM